MTLVASFDVKNWPVLVGDIMKSEAARGRETIPFNIPTHTNVNARMPLLSGRFVSGLAQKVTILTPQLALAWSGSPICARLIFEDILQQNATPVFHDVKRVLDERRDEAGMVLYVTGICLGEAQGAARPTIRFAWDSDTGWVTKKRSLPEYGDCYAGGTGDDAFLDLLGSAAFQLPAGSSPPELATCLSLGHLGKLSGDQLRCGAGLDNSFGGAFEIVTLLAGELKKIGDVAYHFLEARKSPDGQMTITFHASLKIEYFEDYLVIRKLEFGGEVANTIRANERYIIRPVHRSVDDAERARLLESVPRPSMNARFSVFYVHMPEKKQSSQNTCVSVHKSGTLGQSPMIAFDEGEDGVQMQIHPEVIRHVRQALIADTT